MFPIISYSTDFLKKKKIKKIKKTLIKERPISYTRFTCRASSVHQMYYLLPHPNTQPDGSMLHLVLDQGSPFSVTSKRQKSLIYLGYWQVFSLHTYLYTYMHAHKFRKCIMDPLYENLCKIGKKFLLQKSITLKKKKKVCQDLLI